MTAEQTMGCFMRAAVLIFAVFLSRLYGQDPLQGWQFKSEGTHGMVLVSVEGAGTIGSLSFTSFSFKNVSDKVVIAFAMTFGAGSSDPNSGGYFGLDCFGHDLACFRPGAVYTRKFSTDMLSQISDHTITIRAVLFGDDTGEGSPGVLRQIRATHLGVMLETERVKGILTNANKRSVGVAQFGVSATEGDMSDKEVQAMVEQVGSLPRSAKEAIESLKDVTLPGSSVENVDLGDKGAVVGFHSGVSRAREDALRRLNALRQLPGQPQGNPPVRTRAAYLSQLKQEYERVSAKDKEFLQHAQGGDLR